MRYNWLNLEEGIESAFDKEYADCPAQYSKNGAPRSPWEHISTTLKDINTEAEHYVKLPARSLVIDIDGKTLSGYRSLDESLKIAEKFPPTYMEVSPNGLGVRLHYEVDKPEKVGIIYLPENVKAIYFDEWTANTKSIRRILTRCNKNDVYKAMPLMLSVGKPERSSYEFTGFNNPPKGYWSRRSGFYDPLENVNEIISQLKPAEDDEEENSDPVNHPSHYTSGKYEVIDIIEDQKLPYHLGNTMKYICRAGKKDPTKTIEDLEKARWYLDRYIELLKKRVIRKNYILYNEQ